MGSMGWDGEVDGWDGMRRDGWGEKDGMDGMGVGWIRRNRWDGMDGICGMGWDRWDKWDGDGWGRVR